MSKDELNLSEKIILGNRFGKIPLITGAVYSDETENFVTPANPKQEDSVNIKIRVGKNNVDKIMIHYGQDSFQMKEDFSEGLFTYYCVLLPPAKEKRSYYFELFQDREVYFYTKNGVTKERNENFDFVLYRNFEVPDWAKGAVMYQIFPDRFYNADTTNDVVTNEYIYLGRPTAKIEDWFQYPSTDDIRNFYGGDLQGIIEKMEYLSQLGIEVIYLNPIFVSPSNHKYDIQDYDSVDPHLGKIVKDGGGPLVFEKFNNRHASMYIARTTQQENLDASNQLFAKLVEIAHKNGIKVILDGVFNHCGAFNKWLDREGFYANTGKYPAGAYRQKDSIYHDFFRWYDNENWPNNDCYDGWWGYDNHPKLNYEQSKQLYDYIIKIGQKWVSAPFYADGWRLDVAADLGYSEEFNHKFWADFRKAVKQANPQAVILAEHYGDASTWLNGDQWDTIMNYDAFMEPISYFLTGMEKHSESYREDLYCNGAAFEASMKWNMAKLPIPSLQSSMNELSNHDHSRFLTRTNRHVGRLHTVGPEAAEIDVDKAIMREAVLMQMTWPGSPTIYYGDEAGLAGWTDPDNRRTYPWGKEDKSLISFHKELIQIRKKNPVLRKGSLEFLISEYGIVGYGRFNDQEKIVTIINNGPEKEVVIPVWRIGVQPNSKMQQLLYTNKNGFFMQNKFIDVKNGCLTIMMEEKSGILLKEY